MIALSFTADKAYWFISIFFIIISIIVRIGYTKIFLRVSDGESPKILEIFNEYKLFWKYIWISILHGLVIIGGLLLLIIPGIFWAIRFSFASIILIDTTLGPVASMKESYAITKGNFWKLLLFWIVIGLINLIGLMLFMVGLLISIPVSTIATIYIYRKLSRSKAGIIISDASPTTA